jgi:hypothetical protein
LNFRDREQAVPNAISLASILILVVLLLWMLLGQKPTVKGLATSQRKNEMKAKIATRNAEERAESANKWLTDYAWKGTEQNVTPVALASVNGLLEPTKIKMISFRPQRMAVGGKLSQVPYVLTLEGSFAEVKALIPRLERKENKLAVNLVQIASADSASDKVTATIGLIAYLAPEPPKLAEPTTVPSGAKKASRTTQPKEQTKGG